MHFFSLKLAFLTVLGVIDGILELDLSLEEIYLLLLKLSLLDQILDVTDRLWVGGLILVQQEVEEQRILAQLWSAC